MLYNSSVPLICKCSNCIMHFTLWKVCTDEGGDEGTTKVTLMKWVQYKSRQKLITTRFSVSTVWKLRFKEGMGKN